MKPIAILLLLAITTATLAPASPTEEPRKDTWRKTCTVPLLAITTEGKGIVASLGVTVEYPGNGTVYLSAVPATAVETQESAFLAAMAASIVAGVDMSRYNFYYDIRAPAEIVGGPSGGAEMALATLMLLRGKPCPHDIVATGAVMPDTSIAPVGGLEEKLQAAARAGISVVVVPWGQLVYYEIARSQAKGQPINFSTTQGRLVNLPLTASRLGINVYQAPTLLDIYYIALHGSPKRSAPTEQASSPPSATRAAESAVRELVASLRSALEASSTGQERAENSLERAESLLREGSLAGAARTAITGLQEAYEANPQLLPRRDELLASIGEAWRAAGRATSGGVNIFSILAVTCLSAASYYAENGQLPRAAALLAAANAMLRASQEYRVAWSCEPGVLDASIRAVRAGLLYLEVQGLDEWADRARYALELLQNNTTLGERCGITVWGLTVLSQAPRTLYGPNKPDAASRLRSMVYVMAPRIDPATLLLAQQAGTNTTIAAIALLAAWLQASPSGAPSPATLAEKPPPTTPVPPNPSSILEKMLLAGLAAFATGLATASLWLNRRRGASLGVS